MLTKISLNHKRFLATTVLTAALLGITSIAGATVREGDKGQQVTQIQGALAKLGYKVTVDGSFGKTTLAAVKDFQKAKGLEVDGLVGNQTYSKLMNSAFPEPNRGVTDITRRIVSTAMSYVGVPYVFGGTSPSGFDCSGYIQYVFRNVGISLPRTADVQFNVGKPIPKAELRAGDLVFFETYEPGPSHVGIYLGNGKFIHASSYTGITVTNLDSDYYRPKYLGARRL